MKKTVFVLIACLFALGLIFGCDEVTNDPNGPVGNSLYDSKLTGSWINQSNDYSYEFNFDGQGNFNILSTYGETTQTVNGTYKTINGIIYLNAPDMTPQDQNIVYTMEGNQLTLTSQNGYSAPVILTKKGTTPPPQENLTPPELPE